MKVFINLILLAAIITGCSDGLPSQGDIIENKLTQERYKVECSGKLLKCLRIAKLDSSIYNFRFQEGNKASTQWISIYVSEEDSIKNPNVVTYYEKEEEKMRRFPNDGIMIFTTKDWEYIEAVEFEKEWQVIN